MAALLAPKSEAGRKCLSLTDFCDRVQIVTTIVGGEQGVELVGLWDWTCDGLTPVPMAGSGGAKLRFAGSMPNGPTINWSANKSTGLTDVYETSDGRSESPLAVGIGFVLKNGSCGFSRPRTGKPLNSLR
jgi:hypothetical protein